MSKLLLALLLPIILALVGTAAAADIPPAWAKKQTASAQTSQRYQIFFSPLNAMDVYLLDTQTGRVWIPTIFTDIKGTPTVWSEMDRVDNPPWLKLGMTIIEYMKLNPPVETAK